MIDGIFIRVEQAHVASSLDSLRMRRAVYNPIVGWWKKVADLPQAARVWRTDTGLRQPDTLGAVRFEIANPLGNVVAVVSDRKIAVDSLTPLAVQHFVADRLMLRVYYAFGMAMPGRSWAADSGYRFGFNGKENLALAGWQDYGMRIYDRLTSRFISADPLIVYGQKYAELSPYQFAGNRPIDGIDKDGLEWESNKNSSGGIDISVNVEAMFDPEIDENMYLQSGYTKQDYMNAVSEQLDRTMKNSFGNNYSGCVTFNGGNSNTIGQLVPRLIFLGTDAANTGISGMTSNSEASVAMINGGELRSPRDVALDAVHELLHTLRLDHPFELVQTEDTKLIKIGSNEYAAPSTTNDNITHNIMNYGMIRVNGYRLSDYWCVTGRSPDLITSGQLQFINNEILLQKSGCGLNNSIENSSFPKYFDVERRPGYEIECR